MKLEVESSELASGTLSEEASLREAELATEAVQIPVAHPALLMEEIDGINPLGSF